MPPVLGWSALQPVEPPARRCELRVLVPSLPDIRVSFELTTKDLTCSGVSRRLLATKRQGQRPHTAEDERVEPRERVGRECQVW